MKLDTGQGLSLAGNLNLKPNHPDIFTGNEDIWSMVTTKFVKHYSAVITYEQHFEASTEAFSPK